MVKMKDWVECPNCGNISLNIPYHMGTKRELIVRIEFLEHKLYKIVEENKDLRILITKL